PRASSGVPEVFETPQDEAGLFQLGQFGTGPVSHRLTKGARYGFFKNCPFGIGDRSRSVHPWGGPCDSVDRARAASRAASADAQYGGYENAIEQPLCTAGGFAASDNREMALHPQFTALR